MSESGAFCAAAFQRNEEPRFCRPRGGSVIVSPNWLTLSLGENVGSAKEGGGGEEEEIRSKGPKGKEGGGKDTVLSVVY